MTLDEAIIEFEFDCKIRHLSLKTIDNYRKQLRYQELLEICGQNGVACCGQSFRFLLFCTAKFQSL